MAHFLLQLVAEVHAGQEDLLGFFEDQVALAVPGMRHLLNALVGARRLLVQIDREVERGDLVVGVDFGSLLNLLTEHAAIKFIELILSHLHKIS